VEAADPCQFPHNLTTGETLADCDCQTLTGQVIHSRELPDSMAVEENFHHEILRLAVIHASCSWSTPPRTQLTRHFDSV